MKILLLAATQMEIQPFLQTRPAWDVLIGGIGIAATTYHLTRQLSHHRYDLVVQAGIGGTFSHTQALGEVQTIRSDAFGDLGVMEAGFRTVQDLQLSHEPEWLDNDNYLLQRLPYQQVKAITVNTLHTNDQLLAALRQKWQADTESMEGAALHYVCRLQQLPFLQLRSISNRVGIRDKSQWRMKEAILQLNDALQGLPAYF